MEGIRWRQVLLTVDVENIQLAGHCGDSLPATYWELSGADEGPALLVVHGEVAPSGEILALTEHLAGEGFRVLVPGLLAREDEYRTAALEDQPDRRVLADLEAGLEWLGTRADVDSERLGVIGVAGGGTHAFLLACTSRRLECAVAFQPQILYPALSPDKPIQPLELALNLSCPILLDFSGHAAAITREHLERLRTTLDQFGKTADILDPDHADPDVLLAAGGRYDSALSFLRTYLEEPTH